MNGFIRITVNIFFLACILLEIYHAEEVAERQCNYMVNPDDEPNNGTFDSFATELESYTGLGQAPHSITLSCELKPCIINPNGTAIWEARMHFYTKNMMSNNNDPKTTLDGCLCFSEDSADFQNCMDEVRQNMMDQFETVLMTKFIEIVESNCTTYAENCL
ncbi:uncharacterized protein LOC108908545 isoform X2 [Anoplophora glabripennis]|uniref:uncharacterized protein LOC108908545 isoform X2 n=1 Tax=Anoplophora glabripennis TaxID=217634 RepID=UPI0008752BAE|nr:uncharacterized protein LOC108908545 isoform X2 [Anoplophora glabripennis]